MSYIVGAYAAAPTSAPDHAAFIGHLAQDTRIRGLELSFHESLATTDPNILAATHPDWEYVVTAFPGTMLRAQRNPAMGLASPDAEGRAAAIASTRELHRGVEELNSARGRAAVIAIELHSSPTRIADPSAFGMSLAEILSWDWGGATITVEHCDAYVPRQTPGKGFLTLHDELEVLDQLRRDGHRIGMTINWARSVIEERDSSAARNHVEQASRLGLLTGLMFSGVSPVDSEFAGAWVDAHLPPSVAHDAAHADLDALGSSSLLTAADVHECRSIAGEDLEFTGLKIGVRPLDAPVEHRVRTIVQSLDLLDRATAPR